MNKMAELISVPKPCPGRQGVHYLSSTTKISIQGKMSEELDDRSAHMMASETEVLVRQAGISGTPSWLVDGKLIPGLLPRNIFIQIADQNLSDRK
jgi:predicted DsbA family dithiol-disulfide isomerase